MRSPTRKTSGAVAPIPSATGTAVANVRRRCGTSAKTKTIITGVAYSEPLLRLNSATSASTTAPPASNPRKAHGRRVPRASSKAGQKAISHCAAVAFG